MRKCFCVLEFSVWSLMGFGILWPPRHVLLQFNCVFDSFDCSAHSELVWLNIIEIWRDILVITNREHFICFRAYGPDNCVTSVQKGWDVSWDSGNLLSQHKFNYWLANSLVLLLMRFWTPADNITITIPLKLLKRLHFYFVCHGWSGRPFHQDGDKCDYMITLFESHVSCFDFCSRWEWFIAVDYTWKISPWGTSECKIKTTA